MGHGTHVGRKPVHAPRVKKTEPKVIWFLGGRIRRRYFEPELAALEAVRPEHLSEADWLRHYEVRCLVLGIRPDLKPLEMEAAYVLCWKYDLVRFGDQSRRGQYKNWSHEMKCECLFRDIQTMSPEFIRELYDWLQDRHARAGYIRVH